MTSYKYNKTSRIKEARKKTEKIFSSLEKLHFYEKYELIWASYQRVYYYLLAKDKSKYSEKKRLRFSPLRIVLYIFLMSFSLISFLYIFTWRRGSVAIFSEDFYNSHTRSDIRFGDLYKRLTSQDIKFYELVRSQGITSKEIIINLIKRRRPVIYITPIQVLFRKIFRKYDLNSIRGDFSDFTSYDQKVIKKIIADEIPQIALIKFYSKIFSILGTKRFLCWEYGSRTAALITAAKAQKVTTIGIVHGLPYRDYAVGNFITPFSGAKLIGPDIMGVWSKFWKDYFKKYSSIYGSIEVSGFHRERNISSLKPNKNKRETILWISEPLAEPADVVPYILEFLKYCNVIIQPRPQYNDVFLEKLRIDFPELLSLVRISEESLYEAISKTKIVIGTMSTALLEATRLNKNFLTLNTPKWGNYFELETRYFVEKPSLIPNAMRNISRQNILSINERIFGKSEDDGITWLTSKLKY